MQAAVANEERQRLVINLQNPRGFNTGEHLDFALAQPAMLSQRRLTTLNDSLPDSGDPHCDLVRHVDFPEHEPYYTCAVVLNSGRFFVSHEWRLK
ncbi:MAG: hypothetical protein L0229_16960 [Blastocatellia bacterium]|nr:hypothetical protein [Blastocatellia bacterium]